MKKKIGLLYVLIMVSVALTSCGSDDINMAPSTQDTSFQMAEMENGRNLISDEITVVEESMDMAAPMEEAPAMAEPDAGAGQAQTGMGDLASRKLIRRADMSVETEEFDALLTTLEEKVKSLGGYMENFSTNNNSNYYDGESNRHASMTVRIPEANYDQFVSKVAEVSNILSRNESAQDITLQYVDLESHKKVLQTEQERMLALLEKADNIEDIIVLESRLSEIRYQIESMESQLRTYDNLVDYSTIYLNVNEVRQLTPVQEQTTWDKISTGFAKSWSNLGSLFKNMFILLVVMLPYLIVIGAIAVIILLIVKVCTGKLGRKKTRNHEDKKDGI